MAFALRDYQAEIVDNVRAQFAAGTRRVLIQLPTGGGKTALTANMFGTATERGNRSFFICHRRELIAQASATFEATGIPHGIVAAGMTGNRAAPVQVCGIQTLANRLERYGTPTFIAFDEAHHVAAGTWRAVYEKFPRAFIVGLTATPERLDGQGLDEFFDVMVEGPTTADLIARGYLSPFRLFAPAQPDLTGIATARGDFERGKLAAAMDKPAITGDAVSHYRKLASGKRAVVFCASIQHSQTVVKSFQAAGYMALHVDGTMSPADRDAAVRAFERGAIQILSNVDLFGEGFDLPAIEVAILLRPTKSLGLYLQQVGRALRTSPGKTEAIILDHAGNSARHGLPDDPRQWSLAGREKRPASKSEVGVKTCPVCYRVVVSTRPACSCGHVFAAQPREIKHRDGELHEVTARREVSPLKREQQAARTLEELIRIGTARGYKNPAAWASHVIRGRQGSRFG